MKQLFPVVLLAGRLSSAHAADRCGPGCHMAPYGGCVVDGWGNAATAPALNECPVGARARRPCPHGYVWRFRACFPN